LLEECAAALDNVVGLSGALAVCRPGRPAQPTRAPDRRPARDPERLRRVACGCAQSVQAGRAATCSEQTRVGKGTEVMGKVRTGHATSLDGFIAGPNDGPEAPMGEGGERLLGWYFGGDTEYRLPGTEMVFKVAPQTAELLRQTRETTGALVTDGGHSTSPTGGVADTPWTCRSLLLPIRLHQSG
jgi:hypothetical protein